MLVNRNDVENSIIVVASKLINNYIENGICNVNDLLDSCIKDGLAYSSVILSIDWLYMTGVIKGISGDGVLEHDFSKS